MFSAKNYGLPRDLIEAAKRVHEKQLEEAFSKFHYEGPNGAVHIQYNKENNEHVARFWKRQKDGSLKRGSYNDDYYADDKSDAHVTAKKMVGKKPSKRTKEKLAEAFAIFLEENFHVEMLTEEDLDYVFENEFPQWLEEQRSWLARQWDSLFGGNNSQSRAATGSFRRAQEEPGAGKSTPVNKPGAATGSFRRAQEEPGASNTTAAPSTTPPSTPPAVNPGASKPTTQPSTPPSTTPPAPTTRKQTGGTSLFQQAKKVVRSTPEDSGRTAIDRLKYMAQRGNRASQRALRGPKKDWRTAAVYNPDVS